MLNGVINPCPYVGQPLKLRFWRFVPNYEPNAKCYIQSVDWERRLAYVAFHIDDGEEPMRTWIMPDGGLSRINLTPQARYGMKLDRLFYHREGSYVVRGIFPNFYLPGRRDQPVWMDYDRSFVFEPIDFAERADAWHRKMKRRSKVRKDKGTKRKLHDA